MNARWSHVRLPRELSYAPALVVLLCGAVGVHADNHVDESQPLTQAEVQPELPQNAAGDDARTVSETVFLLVGTQVGNCVRASWRLCQGKG